MAELRKIVRANPLSSFGTVVPEGGQGWAALADMAASAFETFDPIADDLIDEEFISHGDEHAENSGVGRILPPAPPEAPAGGDLSAVTNYTATGESWLQYENAGKIRDKPISGRLKNAMGFLGDMGITMSVFSGGQDAKGSGGKRTGSTRHDHGEAADVFFSKDGRRLSWENQSDIPILQDIVRKARSNGVSGFGAGEGYMQPGSMHLGFGKPAVWGAGGKGSNAPAWLREAFSAPTGKASAGVTAPAAPEPAVVVRTEEGRLEPMQFSPLAGPQMRRAKAAYSVGYLAKTTLRANEDLAALRLHHKADPDAFRAAAKTYVDELASAAPESLRYDVRAAASEDASRHYLGIVAKQQADGLARADNASSALMGRLSSDLSEAVAAGREEDAGAIRSRLEGVLVAREALGVNWTRTQSENVLIGALDRAEQQIEQQRREADREAEQAEQLRLAESKDRLQVALDAAKNNRASEYDSDILNDPTYGADHPDLADEVTGRILFNRSRPNFMAAPPSARQAAMDQEQDRPQRTDWDGDFLPIMEDMHEEALRGMRNDPIGFAAQHHPSKPPALPTMDEMANDPASFGKAIADRVDYAEGLRRSGHTDQRRVFSNEERDQFSAFFDPDVPPEAQFLVASAILDNAEDYAAPVLKEMGASQTLVHASAVASAMAATGGAGDALVRRAVTGERMLQEGTVSLPSATKRTAAFQSVVGAGIPPEAVGVTGQMMKTANALYAASAAGLDPASDEAIAAMENAMQEAAGRVALDNGFTGGFQDVLGGRTILPPGITPGDIKDRLRSGLDKKKTGGAFRRQTEDVIPGDHSVWGDQGYPMLKGQRLTRDQISGATLTPVVDGGNILPGIYTIMIGDSEVARPDGGIFVFNMFGGR